MSNKTQKEYSPMKISLLGNVSEITMGSDSSLNPTRYVRNGKCTLTEVTTK